MKALKLNLALFAILFVALVSNCNKDEEIVLLESQPEVPQIEIPAPPKKPKTMAKAEIFVKDHRSI